MNLNRKKVGALPLLVIAGMLLTAACDKEPTAPEMETSGVLPVLVAPVREGPFRIERRFPGLVRAARTVRISVREPGEVAEVTTLPEGAEVAAGDLLLRLHSSVLELDLAEAQTVLRAAELAREREQNLVDLGLASLVKVEEKRTAAELAATRLQRLVLRTSHLEVRSPVAGLLVGRSLPAVGQWCESGHELARIVDPGANLVEVVVPPTWDAAAVRSAELEVGDGVLLAARVISLSPGVDPQRGGRVLSLEPEAGSNLVAGATLTARLRVLMRESALTIPVEALLSQSGDTLVVIGPAAGKQDRLKTVAVICGPSDGKEVVIESGLEAGAWVVLHRPGSSPADYWGWGELFLGVGR